LLAILAAVQAGDLSLLTSEVLEFEIERIPDEHRRREALAMLTLASERLTITPTSEALAASLEGSGLSAMDALHVAVASEVSADFFATTDDRLLRRLKAVSDLSRQPVSLLGLVSEVTK
jgi:predicted nucleic acid-binding protein